MLLTPLPLSQTVALSRTPSPSSMTYFMDAQDLTNGMSPEEHSEVLRLSERLRLDKL